MNCRLSFAMPCLTVSLMMLATNIQAIELPSFLKPSTEPKAEKDQPVSDQTGADIHPKEITKLAPKASVVLDKNCPDLVQPYKLTDNIASLGLFSAKQAIGDLGKQMQSMLGGNKTAPQAPGAGISASTKLAAKQLNWLPMSAEVMYGQKLHDQETAILDRESKLGKKYYPVADKMLQDILSNIGQPHEYKFKLYILKNSTRNAIARPGGFLYMDQGLIDNPVQHPKAYFALGHEVAHVLQRHETKELQSMVVDSISVKDDLLKTISSAKSDPNAILARVKAEKNQFTQHHVDQELQADSCATRLLSRALPDQQAVANSLNAFLKDLSPPATTPPQTPATSDAEKLGQSVHDVVNSPIKRHPNTQERLQNLRAIYAEIASSAPAKGK